MYGIRRYKMVLFKTVAIAILTKSKIKGVPGEELLKFAGSIPKEDLQLMSEAIKQDCEKVDFDE